MLREVIERHWLARVNFPVTADLLLEKLSTRGGIDANAFERWDVHRTTGGVKNVVGIAAPTCLRVTNDGDGRFRVVANRIFNKIRVRIGQARSPHWTEAHLSVAPPGDGVATAQGREAFNCALKRRRGAPETWLDAFDGEQMSNTATTATPKSVR